MLRIFVLPKFCNRQEMINNFYMQDYALTKIKELGINYLTLMQQVHGCKILQSQTVCAIPPQVAPQGVIVNNLGQGDGVFCKNLTKGMAVGILTADCIPMFIFKGNKIMALHVGWRGLFKNFLAQALKMFKNLKKCRVVVGPFMHNFTIGEDFLNNCPVFFKPFVNNNNFAFYRAVKYLLKVYGVGRVYFSPNNTYTQEVYSSFRRACHRDQNRDVRNLNIIAHI